ncbi:UDP-glucose 4-epimerase [hydrothermal vent metagenome]|uniref:UDP-glucose 4-epimerase n=1 Tax=hydrothermal vent metagenome TaxID=652676 RepID=A0A1W1EKP3_9ZZZZ
MKILITGGAGYIASHLIKQLLENTNYNITILDNLSSGSIETLETLKKIRDFNFTKLDLKEFEKVDKFLADNNFDIIFHFAASIIVSESVEKPLKYYMNNTVNTTNLINCAIKNGVDKFVFSSTAAVYGEPKVMPKSGIDENYRTNPINPYGMSKLMSEQVLQDTAKAHSSFKFVIFRYFNVAGADVHYVDGVLSPRIGQVVQNATHLIKVASEVALGVRDKISIFGEDYDTIDGSGVRDYIHVDDLALAHILAIDYLNNSKNSSDIFNIGYGKGFSVKEVISSMKRVTQNDFRVDIEGRRDGDPATLIADNSKIKRVLNWKPKYDDLDLICQSAYKWEEGIIQ